MEKQNISWKSAGKFVEEYLNEDIPENNPEEISGEITITIPEVFFFLKILEEMFKEPVENACNSV